MRAWKFPEGLALLPARLAGHCQRPPGGPHNRPVLASTPLSASPRRPLLEEEGAGAKGMLALPASLPVSLAGVCIFLKRVVRVAKR